MSILSRNQTVSAVLFFLSMVLVASTVVLQKRTSRDVRSKASTSSSFTSTQTLTATLLDDATVREASPRTRYGTTTELTVDKLDSSSKRRQFLMKFQVSGVNGRKVLNAKLRLWSINSSSSNGGTFYKTASNNWSETTVTWSNKPAISGSAVATITGATSTNRWYEVHITPAVTGDGIVSLLALTSSSSSAGYASKQASSLYRPQLILTVENVAATTALTLGNCNHPSLCSGLQAYWNMNEIYQGFPISRYNSHSPSFRLDDGQAANVHVTNCFSPSFCYGKINKSAYFDYEYSNQNQRENPPYLFIPSSQSQPQRGPNGELTIAGWFNFMPLSEEPYHKRFLAWKQKNEDVGFNPEYSLHIQRNGSTFEYWLKFIINDKEIATAPANWNLGLQRWYFFAATYDGSTLKLRVDQTDVATGTAPYVPPSPGYFGMGGFGCPGCGIYTGAGGFIDEVGFWNRALSSAELTTLYNGGSGLTYPFDGTVPPTPTPLPTLTPTPSSTPTPTSTPIPTATPRPAPCYITRHPSNNFAKDTTKGLVYNVWDKPPTDSTRQRLTATSFNIYADTPSVISFISPAPPATLVPVSSFPCLTGAPCYNPVFKALNFGFSAVRATATVPAGSCRLDQLLSVSGMLAPTATPPYNQFKIGLSCTSDYHPTFSLSGALPLSGYIVQYIIRDDSGTDQIPMWEPSWSGNLTNTPQIYQNIRKGVSYPITVRVYAHDTNNSNFYTQSANLTCQ